MSAKVTIDKYSGIFPGRDYVVLLNGKHWMSGLTQKEAQYFKHQLERENRKESMEQIKLCDPRKAELLIDAYNESNGENATIDSLRTRLNDIENLIVINKVFGIKGDSYGYIPLGGDKWRATDGDEFTADLLLVLMEYAGIPLSDILYTEASDAYFLLRSPVGDQEDFESGNLKGENLNRRNLAMEKKQVNEMVDGLLSGKTMEDVCKHETVGAPVVQAPVAQVPQTTPVAQAPVVETHAEGETDSPEHEAGETAEIEQAEKEGAEEAKDAITLEVLADIKSMITKKEDEILDKDKAECTECTESKKCDKHKKGEEDKKKKESAAGFIS